MASKTKVKTVAYTYLVGDLLHFGHYKLLNNAGSGADYHITGVISDEVARKWESPVICDYDERKDVIAGLDCVDEVLKQDSMDPTLNLKRIHRRFPNAKIILYQGHQAWGHMPGVNYVNKIGGEVIRPEYYNRLSRDAIGKAFVQALAKDANVDRKYLSDFILGSFTVFDEKISTKANTLENLKPFLHKARIEDIFVFNVGQWNKSRRKVIQSVGQQFLSGNIVVRSSSYGEDMAEFSNAGAYHSVLYVDPSNKKQVEEAINAVVNDYASKHDKSLENQVLIQSQTNDVKMSGVVFTLNPKKNSPYYLINYDDQSNSTESVTSGIAGSKVEILRVSGSGQIPRKWKKLIASVKEIESLLSRMILDIEFAITKNEEVVIFQVRPLAASRKSAQANHEVVFDRVRQAKERYANLDSSNTEDSTKLVLSDMAFWNPAEIVGDRPNYLDYSLYDYLILKSSWNDGLVPLGYTRVEGGLMEMICSKPYINVNKAFLSLLPEDLPQKLKSKLLDFYLKKLASNPQFHDKIEFEIVHNCYEFTFDERSAELESNDFSKKEISTLRNSLKQVSNYCLRNYKAIVKEDLKSLKKLEKVRIGALAGLKNQQDWRNSLSTAKLLLEQCREYGTQEFSRMARLAFIAKALMKSIAARSPELSKEFDEFTASIKTVASEMDDMLDSKLTRAQKTESLSMDFGHLRPGSYDITQLPYKSNLAYFDLGSSQSTSPKSAGIRNGQFKTIEKDIDELCLKEGVKASGKTVLDFIRVTTQGRESFKFDFTKNLSEALELIAYAGEQLNLPREQMAALDYHTIFSMHEACSKDELRNIWSNLSESRINDKIVNDLVSLPSLIFNANDLYTVQSFSNKPNFITNLSVLKNVVTLNGSGNQAKKNLKNKIVIIEKADPGYDWIFTKDIAGLVTKFGGAASHMAIRCAEFNIAAAIGCGDALYAKAKSADKIQLNCKDHRIDFF